MSKEQIAEKIAEPVISKWKNTAMKSDLPFDFHIKAAAAEAALKALEHQGARVQELEQESERLRELLNRAHQLLRCTKGYKATSLFDDVSKALRGEEV